MPLNVFSGMGSTALATTWAECAAGTVLMCMRIYTNGFITRRWASDFWWALVTYVFSLIATIFLTLSVSFGLGQHLKDLLATDPELINKNQFYQWVFTTFAIAGIALGKLAIIAFILQIEGSATGRRKWVLYGFALSNIIVNVILIPIIWVQCTPTAKMWDESLPGNCNGRRRNQLYGYFQGSYGAILDVALALYPILIFWNLKLQLHVKIGLMVLFGFGVVAAACAAVKTKELSTLTATSDITFELASLNIWASTEMWIVFIVSCIPTIRPIFVKAFNRVYTSTNRSYPTGQGYHQQNSINTPGNSSRVYASQSRKHADSKVVSLPTGADNESEENILPGQQGIMMTSHVVVQFEGEENGGRKGDWKTHFDDSA